VNRYEPTVRPPDTLCRCRSLWRRVRPAFTSVLTFVMSIDNAVDGFGMYQKLDRAAMPAWGYRTTHGTETILGSILWRYGTRRGATMPASCSRSTSEAP